MNNKVKLLIFKHNTLSNSYWTSYIMNKVEEKCRGREGLQIHLCLGFPEGKSIPGQ